MASYDWRPPTAQHAQLAAARTAALAAIAAVPALALLNTPEEAAAAAAPPPNEPVRCCCGRTTSADMVLDVRAAPDEIRLGPDGRARAWLCDGCRERWYALGHTTPQALHYHLGAPAEAIAAIAASVQRRFPVPLPTPPRIP